MKILKGIVWFILIAFPVFWMFTFKQFAIPVIGNFWGQVSVVGTGFVVLIIGIRAFRKGYGNVDDDNE
jgi:hypothetical protein